MLENGHFAMDLGLRGISFVAVLRNNNNKHFYSAKSNNSS